MGAAAGAKSDAHLLGEWARLLFQSLFDAGVRDVWVSPGSRSTPFTWAALHTPGLVARPVIDERSAGFLALGQARVSGRPSALLCTSGSAAANYFPAIVEASLAFLPLIVVTADRPFEVQHAAAAQTIDQLKLYGDQLRRFFELGMPDAAPSALGGLRRAVGQAVSLACQPTPGPVQLNVRARKPLEPRPPDNDVERELNQRVSALLARPLARYAAAAPGPAPEALDQLVREVSGARSGAIVLGPLPPGAAELAEPVAQLARLTGFPILAEATSQLRFALAEHELACPSFDWLLSSPARRSALRPELLLCLGHTPTSSGFERWADEQRVPRIVLCEHGTPDALGTARLVANGDLGASLSALNRGLAACGQARGGQATAFASALLRGERDCQALVAAELEREHGFAEGSAVRSVVGALPEGALLVLGNSLPIRDVDAYVTRAARLSVLCQRGVSGIDGLISGAIGGALAACAPSLLLLGDVSLFHDLGALSSLSLVETPLVIAVLDNDGGRIFDQLPVAELYRDAPELARFWRTPPRRELAHAAALFGMRYALATSAAEAAVATRAGLASPTATLLHLRVAPESAASVRRRVLAALEASAEQAQ